MPLSPAGRNTAELGVGTGTLRRIGRETSVLDEGGNLIAEAIGVEWGLTIEQVPVSIVGSYQDEVKPGGETRVFTLTVQDVDDFWNRLVRTFVEERRDPAKVGAFPEFVLITKVATPGAPVSRWQLTGCKIFGAGQTAQQSEGVMQRQLAGTYNDEEPLDSFEYVKGNVPKIFSATESGF